MFILFATSTGEIKMIVCAFLGQFNFICIIADIAIHNYMEYCIGLSYFLGGGCSFCRALSSCLSLLFSLCASSVRFMGHAPA